MNVVMLVPLEAGSAVCGIAKAAKQAVYPDRAMSVLAVLVRIATGGGARWRSPPSVARSRPAFRCAAAAARKYDLQCRAPRGRDESGRRAVRTGGRRAARARRHAPCSFRPTDEVAMTSRTANVLGIRTCNPRMLHVLELIRRFAALDTPVLVEGETGTGKELVARALHALSTRARGPLVTVDCGALPESLMESELFGHERGAFTGADRSYTGRIQAASGGVLFLDEVNAISSSMQSKLLRFLEQGEVYRIGHQRPVAVDVRLISATNVPLEDLVRAGRMRSDFFYRLNVVAIHLPPLRDRPEDIPLLVQQFIEEDPLAERCGVRVVSDEAVEQLRLLSWPGNVRQLRNVLRQAVVLGAENGVIRRIDHPTVAEDVAGPVRPAVPSGRAFPAFRSWMRECEREYLTALVARHRSVTQQASASRLPQRTLYRKVKALGVDRHAVPAHVAAGSFYGGTNGAGTARDV
jgi:transcriptional regulator with PAS, ATPase and Fis domain